MFNVECPFCDRIASRDYEYESELVVSFNPLSGITPGHRLFVPRSHYEHGTPGAGAVVGECFEVAHRHAGKQKVDSFNLITSYGHAATQTVPHLHIHYVPRTAGDGLQLPWGLPHE